MSVGKACVLILALAMATTLQGASANARGMIEEVYLAKIKTNDERAIIMRSSGETYVIEKGHGCTSLWRYQGSIVLIASPGPFLAFGSKLLIPEIRQHCTVWTVTRGKME